MLLLKFAYSNVFRNKKRVILAMLAIFIGVFSLVALFAFINGLNKDAENSIGRLQAVSVFDKHYLNPFTSVMDLSYKSKLQSFRDSKKVIPVLANFVANIDNKKNSFSRNIIIAVKKNDLSYMIFKDAEDSIIKGSFITDKDKEGIVISRTLADKYNKSISSKIKVNGKEFTIKGIFDSDSKLINNYLFISQKAFRDKFSFPSDKVSFFYLIPKDPSKSDALAKKINFKMPSLKAVGQNERMQLLGSLLKNLKILFFVVLIISSIIASLGVVNLMLMSVIERFKEIASLRAVGWTKENVFFMIIMEAMIITAFASFIAIISALLFAYILSKIISLPFYIDIIFITMVFFSSLLLSIIAALYPAYIAAKLNIVDAFRVD